MALVDTLGFTTINNDWETLTNKELAKHDILLEFATRKGECDWDQSFGTTIMDKIFQPKIEELRLDIMGEIEDVIENDPRVSLIELQSQDLEKGWIFTCSIQYLNGTPDDWIFSITEDGVKLLSDGTYPL